MNSGHPLSPHQVLDTILEGVQRPEDLQLAEALGVDFVQGFLFREKFILVRHD